MLLPKVEHQWLRALNFKQQQTNKQKTFNENISFYGVSFAVRIDIISLVTV